MRVWAKYNKEKLCWLLIGEAGFVSYSYSDIIAKHDLKALLSNKHAIDPDFLKELDKTPPYAII